MERQNAVYIRVIMQCVEKSAPRASLYYKTDISHPAPQLLDHNLRRIRRDRPHLHTVVFPFLPETVRRYAVKVQMTKVAS